MTHRDAIVSKLCLTLKHTNGEIVNKKLNMGIHNQTRIKIKELICKHDTHCHFCNNVVELSFCW